MDCGWWLARGAVTAALPRPMYRIMCPSRTRLHARSQVLALRRHDLRHPFGYRLSEAFGHNRTELDRRLGHANDRYLRLYTNPPDGIAASYVEDL